MQFEAAKNIVIEQCDTLKFMQLNTKKYLVMSTSTVHFTIGALTAILVDDIYMHTIEYQYDFRLNLGTI